MSRIIIIEGDEANACRLSAVERAQCQIRLHEILPHENYPRLLDMRPLLGDKSQHVAATEMILSFADNRKAVTVASNSSYGCHPVFLTPLYQSKLNFSVVVRPSIKAKFENWKSEGEIIISEILERAEWNEFLLAHPTSCERRVYHIADLGKILIKDVKGRLIIVRLPQVQDKRGILFIFTSHHIAQTDEAVNAAFWTKWIKPFVRKDVRAKRVTTSTTKTQSVPHSTPRLIVPMRPNIAASRRQDEAACESRIHDPKFQMEGALAKTSSVLNTVELFAGAGGMGLGFLGASQSDIHYRLIFSGEVHPIYARTLQRNYHTMPLPAGRSREKCVPQDLQPYDLTEQKTLNLVARRSAEVGGTHVLIGGPPCQGFSSANRNSGCSGNPHNRLLDVYFKYVEKLKPLVFLMENVQGVVWTPKSNEIGSPMVVEDLAQRMKAMGYLVFPKLLDAKWYGVPQHRSRFFLLGIHKDLGYDGSEFGEWGPFPLPSHGPGTGKSYVTVQDAFRGLPAIENGHSNSEMPYSASYRSKKNDFVHLMRQGTSKNVLWDHVTSKHAPYVIERYRAIPSGGNWESIRHLMTNYATTDHTHSNIYRRLRMDEPSITIGHYRKSMLIHPKEDRGLSLREAARLQSFPDWFRFVGKVDGDGSEQSGLSHKQQQLANAVCPLMLKQIAEYILQL